MNERRLGIGLVLAVLGAVALSGATSCGLRDGVLSESPAESITIGMEATPVNSLIYIADERGFFADSGIDVVIQDDFASGAAAVEGMLGGEVDVVTAAELVVVRMAFAGENIQTLATIDEFEHQYLIARHDRGIADLADLPGKTIGVPMKTAAQFSVDRFFVLNGVPSDELIFVDVQAPDAVDALESGAVDAVVAWQPNAAALKRQFGEGASIWPIQNMQPTYCAVLTTNAWAAESPEAAERLMEALSKAEDYVIANEDAARTLIQGRLEYDDDYMDEIWPEHEFSLALDQALIIAMEDQARWLIDSGSTETTGLPNFTDYIDVAPLKATKPEAVTIIE